MERNSNLEHLWDFAMPRKKPGLMRKTSPKPMSKQQAIAQDNRDKGKTSLRKANEVPGASSKRSINRMQKGGKTLTPEQMEGAISRKYESFKPSYYNSPVVRGDARDRYYGQVTDSSTFKGRMADVNKFRQRPVGQYPGIIDSLYHSPDADFWKGSANYGEQEKAVGAAQFKDWQAIRASRKPGYIMSNMKFPEYLKKQAGTENPSNEFRGIRQALYQPDASHTAGVSDQNDKVIGAMDMNMQYDPAKSPQYTAQTRRRRTVDGLLGTPNKNGFTPYTNGQKIP